jgi:hypothetical protein
VTINDFHFVFAYNLSFDDSIFVSIVKALIVQANDGDKLLGSLWGFKDAMKDSSLLFHHNCFGRESAEFACVMGLGP